MQPSPFRAFPGARIHSLYPAPGGPAIGYTPPMAAYETLCDPAIEPAPLSAGLVGDLLRHALGLSAWKVSGRSRWSLRVNPSSGNLHPTEAYVISGPLQGLAERAAVYHYAVDRHALEERCVFDADAWSSACAGQGVLLVALTSIHWRESWKYGERAFRYCQHDLGHAVGAVALAAAMLGWRTRLLPSWSHAAVAALTGIDRDQDFVDAEREEPGGVLALVSGRVPDPIANAEPDLRRAVREGRWSGRASQLSQDHVQWTFIDEVARATEDPGRALPLLPARPDVSARVVGAAHDARALMLQRRSAVSFDGASSLDADAFFAMLSRVMPRADAPWGALWWTPRIHLLLFVHRVNGVTPGLYLLGREPLGFDRLQRAIGGQTLRQPAHPSLPIVRLARGDHRSTARRLSCDQPIASDGCFSLAMLADFDAGLAEHGPAFYRHLFWEAGVVGQVLYLEAEAASRRATGIGCFYDDPVHDLLGLQGHAFQSLYHFTVGVPLDDPRLATEPGYEWESGR